MRAFFSRNLVTSLALIAAMPLAAAPKTKAKQATDPIVEIVHAIDAKNIERTIHTLVSFGTRNTLSSQDDPKRGIGAARDWIEREFRTIAEKSDGRMTVELQSFEQQPGRYARIATPTRLTNVVATLHGSDPDSAKRVYVVSGHYDSMCTSPTDAQCDAPGADDDASGVATVIETARAMAPHRFNATVVFVAVAGEEQGLVGSTYFAEQAKKNNVDIDAMFTNDIVGNTLGQNGVRDRKTVRVFSEGVPSNETPEEAAVRRSIGGENDSPARELARAIVEAAHRYVPDFSVAMIYRRDRYLRGGDHIPFLEQGYPAVRFTEPNENYNHQHQNVRVENGVQYGDLQEFTDPPYIAEVARVNAAALASFALAPARPRDVRILTTRLTNDTDLQWSANTEPYFDHYEIVWRGTTEPSWTHVKAIGKETTYTAPGISKDNYFFGVRAVGRDGQRSVVTFPVPLRKAAATSPKTPAAETAKPAVPEQPKPVVPDTPKPAPPAAPRAVGSNADLRTELRGMSALDQEVRRRWITDPKNEELRAEVASVDAKNTARLREIIAQVGWPGKSLVGDNGSSDAWTIAQHSGKEALHEMLPLMKAAVERHELDPSLYATSVDRVRIQDGQLQLYGSQFDTSGDKCEPKPIEDAEHVDERRKAMGLAPLAEYAKELCSFYKGTK